MYENPLRPNLSISVMWARGSWTSEPGSSALLWEEAMPESSVCARGADASSCWFAPIGRCSDPVVGIEGGCTEPSSREVIEVPSWEFENAWNSLSKHHNERRLDLQLHRFRPQQGILHWTGLKSVRWLPREPDKLNYLANLWVKQHYYLMVFDYCQIKH